ncbi:unnamed protein product [Rotaria sordida]|uniref:G-protein coupled receptors family 1 profile domain-containing protein n=2 Tax=Rotaria sordida TaxID=392033 RepID=A0A813V3C2_9BILA|nr:unnamed protein product [Rotaria sordida]CAF0882708.1 unnamed protein product [Rotaria sordida]
MCCTNDEIDPDLFMISFNWTNFIPINSQSSMNLSEFEQARCYSPFLIFVFKTQPMLLLIFGFVANLCSFAVLIRPRLRRRPTFSYLAFLSLSNSLLSLIHASFTILGVYYGLTLDNLPLFIFCRFLNRFAIDFLTHFSLYTLTAVDLDRIRTVTSKTAGTHRNSRANGGRQHGCAEAFIRVCLVELFLAVVLFLLNTHWLTSYGYTASSSSDNLNDITECTIPYLNNITRLNPFSMAYNKYLTSILPIIELILFNILPVFISLLATIVILRHVSIKYTFLNQINKRLKKSRRRMELHLSILLISLNCVFILFTTPHNIYSVYIGQLQRRLGNKHESEGELCSISILQKSLDLLQQCYFMSTFFLYILTNKRFREEFYELIKRNFLSCKHKKTNHSSTQNTTRRRHHRHHRYDNGNDYTTNYLRRPIQSTIDGQMSFTDDLTKDDCEDNDQISTSGGYSNDTRYNAARSTFG